MTKYEIAKVEAGSLSDLKANYIRSLSSALDGMWQAFVSFSDHYAVTVDTKTVAYCAVNEEEKILQFHAERGQDAEAIFAQVLEATGADGACLSTGEAHALALCMDKQTTVKVGALLYRLDEGDAIEAPAFPVNTSFNVVTKEELPELVDFAHSTLGADREWLNGYYGCMISRGELLALRRDGGVLATGELRPSVSQVPFADVGMVVGQSMRGQGTATAVLRTLILMCRDKGLSPVCSTECDNVAAQKAITRAGFMSGNRMLEITF
ncbi:MAG: GNAT family N-acetyltransferase [Kordiimonadaceae bacterium]|nr:GNAT family N-acetyltransferase [Kordiimonadaceae bacterium]